MVRAVRNIGLVERCSSHHLASSADGILAAFIERNCFGHNTPSRKELMVMLIEAKTFTAPSTIASQQQLARQFGQITYVNLTEERFTHIRWKELIPDVSHRNQLLHHCSIFKNIPLILYAAASPWEMIRVVVIQFSTTLLTLYEELMTYVKNQHFLYVYDNDEDVPVLTPAQYGRAVRLGIF